jgi:hemolysin III
MSVGGVSYLIVHSMSYDDPWRLWSAIIYGATIILMFTSSTIYHGYQLQPLKHYFRIFDHSTIYLMIGGTMTPFILTHVRDTMGLCMLGLVWVLSIAGILYKIFFFGRSETESVASYCCIAFFGIFGTIPMLEHLPIAGIVWLVAGLFVYLAGVYFYLKDYKPFYHTVWHLFVIGGCACHYIAIVNYVIPAPTV